MSEGWCGVILGTMITLLLVLLTYSFSDDLKIVKDYTSKIGQCEKDLPRSQKCVFIAIPENKEIKGENK